MSKENQKQNNYAFIDSQNLNLGIRDAGWDLDFARFRVYLNEKYSVSKAYLFIGYIEKNRQLYTALESFGYILIFKPVLEYQPGKVKGNVDAELVLQTMIEIENFDGAVIVSGDGDFHCLVRYLIDQDKLSKVLVPNQAKYSALLKKIPSGYLAFVSDLQKRLTFKNEKNPARTKPGRAPFVVMHT